MERKAFEITPDHISRLNAVQLTALLRRLLFLEALRYKLPTSGVTVPLNIHVSDGGEDGRISWSSGPPRTNRLPRRVNLFQVKAAPLTPGQCEGEILSEENAKAMQQSRKSKSKENRKLKRPKAARIKAEIEAVLRQKGGYFFFCGRPYNRKARESRIARVVATVKKNLKKPAREVLIEFYDANLISDWSNEYFPAALYILEQLGQPPMPGLQTWERWSGYAHLAYTFVTDEHLKGQLDALRSLFLDPRSKKAARLVGMSGLGKTRLALEAFRPPIDPATDPNLVALSNRVVYVRAPDPTIVAQAIEWRSQSVDALIVVDDCDRSLHDSLAQEVQHPSSRLSLLTLDFVSEKPQGPNEIFLLEQSSTEVIRGILKQKYAALPQLDLDRIVDFAQGFPGMAVLLAEARLQDFPDMGSLKNNELVRRLLWGRDAPNDQGLKVIAVCALFDVLGVTGTVSEQVKFVSKSICGVPVSDFYRWIVKFQEMGIVERRGDFVRVRPKPLAVRLAADWWKGCHPQVAAQLFREEMPPGLIEQLCSRMAMLDFVEETRKIAADLCEPTGPFGRAEVLNSDRGSRCFCSLVEVNPVAALSGLLRVFGNCARDELISVGPGRRFLVWSLEKLVCRRDTFEGAAGLLLSFAAAENERWANNATGNFLQLFQVYLSGTEAGPDERLKVAIDGLASASPKIREVVVRALGRALDSGPYTRIVGSEFQGSGAQIREWRPKTREEVFNYWDVAEDRLVQIARSEEPLGDLARRELTGHIQAHIALGRIDRIEAAIEKIIEIRGAFWPQALGQLQNLVNSRRATLAPDALARIEKLIGKLQPSDLRSRLCLLVSVPPFEHVEQSDGTFRHLDKEKAEALAHECAQRIDEFLPLVGSLLSGEQRQALPFGVQLGHAVAQPDALIDAIIEALKQQPREGTNPSFLGGVLHSVQERDPALVEATLDKLGADTRLSPYVVQTTQAIRITPPDLERLLILLQQSQILATELESLGYGQALAHLSRDQIRSFLTKLVAKGIEAARAAFEILFFFVYPTGLHQSDFRDLARLILVVPGILTSVVKESRHTVENFLEASNKMISDGTDEALATKLLDEAITLCVESNFAYSLVPSFTSLISGILGAYPQVAWARISHQISVADPLQRFRLQHLLGRGFDTPAPRLASTIPAEILMHWCEEQPSYAPEFLAGIVPPLVRTDEGSRWTEMTRAIIDRFGDKEGVLNQLSANMGTFSYVGSSAPYYEGFVGPLEQLLSHRSPTVRDWARKQLDWHRRMIAEEKKRQEEHAFGIFR